MKMPRRSRCRATAFQKERGHGLFCQVCSRWSARHVGFRASVGSSRKWRGTERPKRPERPSGSEWYVRKERYGGTERAERPEWDGRPKRHIRKERHEWSERNKWPER